MDYKREGYLPEALFNFLALLGWAPGDDREKMTRSELAMSFNLEQISPKSSVFDEKKLEWMNGLYMAERPVGSLVDEVTSMLKERGVVNEATVPDTAYIEQIIGLLRERSKRIRDLVDAATYFFVDPVTYEEKAQKKFFSEDAANALTQLCRELEACTEFSRTSLEGIFRTLSESNGLPIGKLIHPTRLAVSGVSFGPGLYELLETLGKDRVVRRIKKAVDFINSAYKAV